MCWRRSANAHYLGTQFAGKLLMEFNRDQFVKILNMTKKKILIVNDEEDLTWSILRGLSKDKHRLEVFHANSGGQALDLLNKHAIDLLVTDLRMPGINGRELIQQVRSAYPRVKIILMTAFFSSGNQGIHPSFSSQRLHGKTV